MLTWLHWQIPVRWQPCSLLTKKQQYAMTMCIVHVYLHGFPRQNSIGTCQILEGRAGFLKNRQEECLGVASVITFACSHISRSDLGAIGTSTAEEARERGGRPTC